ncbi:hypothetical protein LOY97_006442 [Ophidiomyces ophidiicola]|nr:hypothetical protein LOY97_006442 [Ophidiomyces ophidiicola]
MTFALKLICQSDELMERMGDHSVHHLKTDFKTQSDVQGSDVPQSSDENHADVIMTVHTQFLHLVKIYKLIKAGTKHGDLCVSVDDKSGFLFNLKPSDIFQNLSSHIATVNTYIMKVLEAGGVDASDENERDTDDVDSCREDAAEIGE